MMNEMLYYINPLQTYQIQQFVINKLTGDTHNSSIGHHSLWFQRLIEKHVPFFCMNSLVKYKPNYTPNLKKVEI